MIILDSNVVSALMRLNPDSRIVSWVDSQPRMSLWTTSITVMEIRYGLAIMPAGRRRSLALAEFERVIVDDMERRILPFDEEAAEQAALLMGARHRLGRPGELRDTMIAGIALAHNATVATRNVRHFDDLHVPVVDPWRA
jgi:predicted nucleic acid-binding protein